MERKDPKFLRLALTGQARPTSRQEVLRDVSQRMFRFPLSSISVRAK